MSKNPHIVPIPGTRNMNRMIENAGAADVVLSKAETAEIDAILDTLPQSENPLGR